MQHTGEVAPSLLEALADMLTLVPRAGYLVEATGRVRAVNALAGSGPADVAPSIQRALCAAVRPSGAEPGFRVIPIPMSPAPLFLVFGASAPDPLEQALPALARRFDLTPAEAGVLAMWIRGRTQGQIASARGTGEGTVHVQLQHIRSKLGVSRRSELVTFLRSQVGL